MGKPNELSARARLLAQDLRDLAGNVTPAVWQRLRPLANEAAEIADLAERSEDFEATVLGAAREEVERRVQH